MTVEKLEKKVSKYAEEGHVSLTSASFSRLCERAR
jgi:hypothetical protein